MKRLIISLFATVPVIASAGEFIAPAASPAKWEWTFSAGPAVRDTGSVRTTAGYRSKNFSPPSFVGGDSLTIPSIGGNTPADREYNDGYVRQDAGTPNDGSTWYWGYESASQVQSGQLVYAATGYESIRRDSYNVPASGPNRRNDLTGFAPHLQIDARGPRFFGGFRLGFSAGFDWLQVDQSFGFSNYSGTQYRDDFRHDYQDRYDLDGVTPPLDPYGGGFSGPGPLISNTPTSRTMNPVLLNTDSAYFYNQVSSSIDIDLYTFTFGPTLSKHWGPLAMSLQAGVIFNIYNWKASQSETLKASNSTGSETVAEWSEGNSGRKFRPGVFAQVDVAYDLGHNCALGGFLRYDISSRFRANAGPTIFEIEPGGATTGLMLRYTLP